jgi:hypothetical protein
VRRRLEPEWGRIADVEIAHAPPRGLHTLRLDRNVADGVGEVGNPVRDRDRGPAESVGRGHASHLTPLSEGRVIV